MSVDVIETVADSALDGGMVDAYVVPVSFAQERLWLLDRMDPGKTAYVVPLALRLRGALDAGALQRACDELARRHESLRTVFQWIDDGPMQVVLPDAALPVRRVDLSATAADAREGELRRRLAEETARPFDLAQGPLVRARLYRLGEADHVLLLHLHHIVTDGWSNGVIVGELAALYTAFARGGSSPLPEPELQYADYAEWQREQLEGARLERQLAWWTAALAGAPALLELPADRPRPPVQSGRGAVERFALPPDALDAVQALARAEGATPFMVLLAAFQALLGRYARQDDVVVGTPAANRARPETHGVVGFFVNTLALRGDLSGDPSFRALLRRVRETTLGAFAHPDLPFERLVDALKAPRSAAHAPVFQAMFILQNTLETALSFHGLGAERMELDAAHAPFDVTLGLRARGGGLEGALEYDAALFDPATARRMIAHYRRLLEAACAAPDTSLSALPWMTAGEVDSALRAWEGPALPVAPETIHARIARQAARTPEAVAIDGGAERWTYAELEARANGIARGLRAHGVRPGVLVGVRAERSPGAVAAILAVLKAGGAYLPIDPAYPAERQAYMLADSGAPLLLDATGAGAPAGFAGRVLSPADLVGSAEAESEPIEDAADPRDLAYVIYTSGSTGRPKGVMVPHHALVAYVDAAREAYAMTADDRSLQFAPLSFDSSVEELFAPLTCGAAVVLRDGAMLESVDGFWRACERQALTIATLPTAYWHEVAAALERSPVDPPSSLRAMIVGGERALPERVAAWRRVVGDRVRLLNSYGPTETTVAATLHEVGADDEASVPIGRPLSNTRVRVLDATLRPVPPGVPGELFVGGAGVARGYLGRPATTAERFVPDPFASTPGDRLYATGDLARWRPDGTLEYLGRTDDQVKVRGFRVELGEIEALLRRLAGVRDAVAAVREDAPGDRRLVAYVVLADPETPVDGLRDALRRDLPAYMVPSAFVALDALPLSPSGKVDRRALPAPRVERSATGPLSRAEAAVAALWREVLGGAAVGADDNFFDLGGNSLLLIRLAARIAETTGKAATAVELFRYPTVRAQAAWLGGGGEEAEDTEAKARADRLRQGQGRLQALKGLRRAPV
ncbi:MAG TPA: amino acid adenylation domain-containing protein [Longimicrobium sp.]|nr:amino acid adenylation domain-containing protein [Longimicrobium sp.]